MNNRTFAQKLGYYAVKQKAFIAILVILIAMAFSDTMFWTAFNLFDMLNSASINMFVAFGLTMVIIGEGIDLSVGGTLVVSGIISIQMINAGVPIIFAILGAIIAGAIIGAGERIFRGLSAKSAVYHYARDGDHSHRVCDADYRCASGFAN